MSAFDKDISEEEQRGGFDLGAPDDETFKLEKLDAYPGVMPDFDYEPEPIIPADEPQEIESSDDDEEMENVSEEFDELEETPDITQELGDLLGEDAIASEEESLSSDAPGDLVQPSELVQPGDLVQEKTSDEPPSATTTDSTTQELVNVEEEEDLSNVIPKDETEEEKALRELLSSEKDRSDKIKEDKKEKEFAAGFGFGENDIEPVQEDFVPIEEQGESAELIDLSEISSGKPSTFGLEEVVVREADDGLSSPDKENSEEKENSSQKTKKTKKKSLSKKRFILMASSAAVILLSVIGYSTYQIIFNSDDLIIPGDTLAIGYAKSSAGDISKDEDKSVGKNIEKKNEKESNKQNIKEIGNPQEVELIEEASKEPSQIIAENEFPEESPETETSLSSEKIEKENSSPTKDIVKRSTVSQKEKSRKKIKIPKAKRKPQSDKGLFAVQIYSSPSEDDARDWLIKLKSKNIKNGFITTQLMRDKVWYRVRFGEFKTRQKAQAAAMQYGFAQSWVDRIK